MIAITRGRAIIGAGFLAAATLLGTALAAGPAMTHEGNPAMTQEGTLAMTHEGNPAMTQEGTLATFHESKPAPQHQVILTGMIDEAAPAGMIDE